MGEIHQGRALKSFIQQKGYTISQVAESVGKRRETVSRWLKEEKLSTEIITQIAKAMNFDVTSVLSLMTPANGERNDMDSQIPYLKERIKFLEHQLDEQIRINLENAKTIRFLSGDKRD